MGSAIGQLRNGIRYLNIPSPIPHARHVSTPHAKEHPFFFARCPSTPAWSWVSFAKDDASSLLPGTRTLEALLPTWFNGTGELEIPATDDEQKPGFFRAMLDYHGAQGA
jgi:hypothetical protein